MSKLLSKEPENQSPFNFLDQIDKDPDNQAAEEAAANSPKIPPEGEEGDAGSEEQVSITKKELDGMKAQIQKLAKGGIDSEQFNQVMENNKILDAIKQQILPNDGEIKASERRKQEAAFDENPPEFIRSVIREEMQGLEERQTKTEVRTFATEVMGKISQEYDINWEKDGSKIAAELALMDPAFKKRDIKGATLKAMTLAGVGEKRPEPIEFPFTENSRYTTPAAKKKAMDNEATTFKQNLFGYAEKMVRSPLAGFLGK